MPGGRFTEPLGDDNSVSQYATTDMYVRTVAPYGKSLTTLSRRPALLLTCVPAGAEPPAQLKYRNILASAFAPVGLWDTAGEYAHTNF